LSNIESHFRGAKEPQVATPATDRKNVVRQLEKILE